MFASVAMISLRLIPPPFFPVLHPVQIMAYCVLARSHPSVCPINSCGRLSPATSASRRVQPLRQFSRRQPNNVYTLPLVYIGSWYHVHCLFMTCELPPQPRPNHPKRFRAQLRRPGELCLIMTVGTVGIIGRVYF